jgi:hypothetical protein
VIFWAQFPHKIVNRRWCQATFYLTWSLVFPWEDTAKPDFSVRKTCFHCINSVRHMDILWSFLLFVTSFVPKLKIILLTSVVFSLQSTFSSIASMFSAVIPDIDRLHMLGSVTWTLRQFDAPIMTVVVFISVCVFVKFGSPSQSKSFVFCSFLSGFVGIFFSSSSSARRHSLMSCT